MGADPTTIAPQLDGLYGKSGPFYADRSLINGNDDDLSDIITINKSNLVQIINEIAGRGRGAPYSKSQYLGVVTSGGRLNHAASASNTRSVSYVTYRAAAPIFRPRILHNNWYINTSNFLETNTSATATITDWIEYPVNEKLSAPVTGTVAAGADLINDMGDLVIPEGARFRVWTLRDGPLMPYAQGRHATGNDVLGSKIQFGAAATGPTGPGQGLTTSTGGLGYFPMVLDKTNFRTVMLYGDSHEFGTGDSANMNNLIGPFERYYGDAVGWFNAGIAGDSLQSNLIAGNYTKRANLAQYATDISIGCAGNDISAGRTPAQIIADLKSMIALFPNKTLLTATELPKTTSTDSWATVANQTVTSNESNRIAVNIFKRSGAFHYYLDFEGAVGVINNNSVVWPAGGSADGLHGNELSYSRVTSIRGPMFRSLA